MINHDAMCKYADSSQKDFEKYDLTTTPPSALSSPSTSTSTPKPTATTPTRVSLSPIVNPVSLSFETDVDKRGVVSCLPRPLISKLDQFREMYHRAGLVYDQLQLISDRFEGQVLGPVCLYLSAKPDQEEAACMCLDTINNSFLMKITCAKHADCFIIKEMKTISADVYMVSGPFDELMDVPEPFQHHGFDTLHSHHPMALNVLLNLVIRLEECRLSHDCLDVTFDEAEDLLREWNGPMIEE